MNNQLIRGNLFLFSKPEPESKQFEKGERFFLNQAGTTESLFIVLRVTKENQLILARAFPTQQKNTCKVIIGRKEYWVRFSNLLFAERKWLSDITIVKDKYDYVLIDCMPSLGMITFNALTAADSVIIPVQAQYLPAKGMTQLLGTIAKVRKHTNADLKIDGILLTLVDGRTNLAKSTVEALRENFGSHIRIYRSMIPAAVKAAEVSSKGTSIYAYEPNSPVSKAYAGFTKEVLADGRQKERLHAAHEHAR